MQAMGKPQPNSQRFVIVVAGQTVNKESIWFSIDLILIEFREY